MNKKYKNKYHIKSTRLQNWDYGWNGAYFVTVCTQNRIHYFGKIENGEMILTDIGKTAQKYWYEIPQHFSFVKLGAFVVMPNHIHGIIIDKTDDNTTVGKTATIVGNDATVLVETPKLGVSTTDADADNIKTKMGGKNPKWKSGSLGSIINQYKRICTIDARKTNPDFAWQPRYYDHIIRDRKSFNRITQYIINNPLKWNNDKFYINDNNNIVSEPVTIYHYGNFKDVF